MSVRSLSKEKGTATSQSKSRIEQVLLAGLENERAKHVISPSKPIGLFGGVQRMTNQKSNHLLETLIRFRMFAGKETRRHGRPFYEKATSYESAQGIFAELAVGCYFRPNWHFEPDEVVVTETTEEGEALFDNLSKKKRELMTKVTLAGLRFATNNGVFLFTEPLKDVLGWDQVANKVRMNLYGKVFNKGDVPEIKIEKQRIRVPPVIHDVDQLTQEEADQARSQFNEIEVMGTKVEAAASAYLNFKDHDNFDIQRPYDDSMAHAMHEEFEQYSSKVFERLKNDAQTFATVCMRGTTIEVSFDQLVDGVLDDNGMKEEFEEATKEFTTMDGLMEALPT